MWAQLLLVLFMSECFRRQGDADHREGEGQGQENEPWLGLRLASITSALHNCTLVISSKLRCPAMLCPPMLFK